MKLQRYNCRTVRNMLPLHVGGDLDPRHVSEVDRHLHDCLVCFREFRELGSMRGRLAVLAEQPMPSGVLDGFVEEVMARIDVGEPGPAAEAPSPGPRQQIVPFHRLAAAAAVMLVALAGWRAMEDQGLVHGGVGRAALPAWSESVSGRQPIRQSVPVLRALPASPHDLGDSLLDRRARGSGTISGLGRSAQPGAAVGQSSSGPSSDEVNELLETAWPLGVPAESEVQVILRSHSGVPGVSSHGQAAKASGLQRDDGREPRQRKP